MEVESKPWDFYTRASSVAGWTFPVGQTQIRDALLAAGVRVRYLSLGGGYGGGPYGVVHIPGPRSLSRSWWSADTNPYRRAVRDDHGTRSGWAGLDFYSVSSAQASTARELLGDGLLNEAVDWIAQISTRGEGWRASDHEFVVSLDAQVVRRSEK